MVNFRNVKEQMKYEQSTGTKGGYFVSFIIGLILILLSFFGLLEMAAESFPYSWSALIGIVLASIGFFKVYQNNKTIKSLHPNSPQIQLKPLKKAKRKGWIIGILGILFLFNLPSWFVGTFSIVHDAIIKPILFPTIYYSILLACGVILGLMKQKIFIRILGWFLAIFSLTYIPVISSIIIKIPVVGELINIFVSGFGAGTFIHTFVIFIIGAIALLSKTKLGTAEI